MLRELVWEPHIEIIAESAQKSTTERALGLPGGGLTCKRELQILELGPCGDPRSSRTGVPGRSSVLRSRLSLGGVGHVIERLGITRSAMSSAASSWSVGETWL